MKNKIEVEARRFFRAASVFALMALFAAGVSAQQPSVAFIQRFAGQVEIKNAGEDWMPVHIGQTLKPGTMISTGFKSSAVIAFGNSTLLARALTKLTVSELAETQEGEYARIDLSAGRGRAEIKKPTAGGKTDFTVKAPSATASVRGTVFEFDTVSVTVMEGTVEFSGESGTPVFVRQGDSSDIDEATGRARPAAETAAIRPEMPVGVAEAGVSAGGAAEKPLTVELNITAGY